ncbi:MAG TPA: hypothetical protein VFK62_06480, partial [Gaiellaceae bacterium]|nr:hypothetical protein [Gaiellaceae bacterium]
NLTAEEREEIGSSATPYRVPEIRGARDVKERPELIALAGVIGALAGIGLDQPWLVVAGIAATALGLVLQAWVRFRSNRLARALATALGAGERERVFQALADVLGDATQGDWIALVRWREDGLGGEIEHARGDGPNELVLMSWLVREAEAREELIATAAHELGGDGAYVALPLRRENSALTGFVVLRSPRALRRYVAGALGSSLDEIGLALAPRLSQAERPAIVAVQA